MFLAAFILFYFTCADSLSSKVIVHIHGGYTHTTGCSTWTIEMVSKNSASVVTPSPPDSIGEDVMF